MTILDIKIVKIRKPHQCFSCFRKFPENTEMQKGTFVEDGIYTLYTCLTCVAFFQVTHEAIRENDGRIDEGWMKEYMNQDSFKGTPEEYLILYKERKCLKNPVSA